MVYKHKLAVCRLHGSKHGSCFMSTVSASCRVYMEDDYQAHSRVLSSKVRCPLCEKANMPGDEIQLGMQPASATGIMRHIHIHVRNGCQVLVSTR